MPSSDYGNAVGGGLKLKGAKDAGVKKKKKKSKPESNDAAAAQPSRSVTEKESEHEDSAVQRALAEEEAGEDDEVLKQTEQDEIQIHGKTEAQRRHEERRKKRLDERLKREGVKTHKERVEELNKYLSNLSEHHDMPRIGPG